jgi:hypothetical protein
MTVHLYTSNSNPIRDIVKIWAFTLFLAFSVLAAMELTYRYNGHIPSVIDDVRLWSVERDKIPVNSHNTIVLLGASRVQVDFSTEVFKNKYPGYQLANLPVDGKSCYAVLKHLSDDTTFKGIAICDITEENIIRRNPANSQDYYVHYYLTNYNLNTKINRYISTLLQERFVIIDPYVNLINSIGYFLTRAKLRPPKYVITYSDRSIQADYSLLDSVRNKQIRINLARESYRELSPEINMKNFTDRVHEFKICVDKIKARGGKVVFIRFPVTDESWNLDEKYFPKKEYWDFFVKIINTETIHFKDVESMRNLRCPDTSHLDKRDISEFTNALITELQKLKIF